MRQPRMSPQAACHRHKFAAAPIELLMCTRRSFYVPAPRTPLATRRTFRCNWRPQVAIKFNAIFCKQLRVQRRKLWSDRNAVEPRLCGRELVWGGWVLLICKCDFCMYICMCAYVHSHLARRFFFFTFVPSLCTHKGSQNKNLEKSATWIKKKNNEQWTEQGNRN